MLSEPSSGNDILSAFPPAEAPSESHPIRSKLASPYTAPRVFAAVTSYPFVCLAPALCARGP